MDNVKIFTNKWIWVTDWSRKKKFDVCKMQNRSKYVYTLKVNLEYPVDLHKTHNNYLGGNSYTAHKYKCEKINTWMNTKKTKKVNI